MTSEKLKPTPGPWRYRLGDEWSQCVVTDDGKFPDGRPKSWTVASMNGRRDEKEDNARLIAEAGTVHHECGLSPRELLEVVRDLRKDMRQLIDAPKATMSDGKAIRDMVRIARAALAKHKEI